MQNKWIIGLLLICFLVITGAATAFRGHLLKLDYPKSWPEPVYDLSKAPLTREKVELGRLLFYDPILSADGTISCSSCHLSYTAFTHVDHALSHGIHDSIGTRNSPALMNLAWSKAFMWDGGVNHLDVQALAPISHPAEMGDSLPRVIKRLQANPHYPDLFQEAFGSNEITGEHLLKALSQFQLTLVSANSKYDKVIRGESSFSEQEQKGYTLFKSHCSSCHTEPLFTNGEFVSNGLPVDSTLKDPGRMKITGNSSDSLKFKVPTLRNIEFSYPYMHDGRFKKLNQVLNHYTTGIQAHPNLDQRLAKPLNLTSNDKVDLIAFLLTLTDHEFLRNPDFGFPRENFSQLAKDSK